MISIYLLQTEKVIKFDTKATIKSETHSKFHVCKTSSLRCVENTYLTETYLNVSKSTKKVNNVLLYSEFI